MGILDVFRKKATTTTYRAPFLMERDRYPAALVIAVWEKANQTVDPILLECSVPNFSIEINGFQNSSEEMLKDFFSHITDFDDLVQDFCKMNYDAKQQEMKNYIVTLEWISIEPDSQIIVMGYCGKYVNIELRAIFEKSEDNWETMDIYYQ